RCVSSKLLSNRSGQDVADACLSESMIATIRWSIVLGLGLLVSNAHADGVPRDCTQLIVAIAPNWDSMRGQMILFERSNAGGKWTSVDSAVPVLFGKSGVAWGSGLA